MPKARKRKAPITCIGSYSSGSSSTSKSSRTIIRRFHVLLKKRSQLEKNTTHDTTTTKTLADIEQEIFELGGLECYQRMSLIGQGNDRGGGSETVLIGWLKEIGADKLMVGANKLRLLEVGALKPHNFISCLSWIDPTPMDLCSRHPAISEQDFLLLDESEHREQWNTISLSLVLNFVPEPKDRGRMLCLAHSILTPGGHLFLALPLPCVANSRYLTFEHLETLMTAVGFVELKKRWKEGGKMAYWLYRKQGSTHLPLEPFQKKIPLLQGNRNNFCILL